MSISRTTPIARTGIKRPNSSKGAPERSRTPSWNGEPTSSSLLVVKPAALGTKTGVIGVLATAGTLKGSKYLNTKGLFEDDVRIVEHVGEGFVELVEKGILDGPEAYATVKASLQPLLDAGADRIVLGCTHYPFLRPVIEAVAGPGIQVIDPAPAVARQTVRLLEKDCVPLDEGPFSIDLHSSGDPESLQRIFALV